MRTNMNRRSFLALTGTAAAASLAMPHVARASGSVRLRYGHSQPVGHSTDEGAKAFIAKARELSGGDIDIALFPSNQLGTDRELQGMIESGSIDFTHTNSATLSAFVPEINVMNYPFMWNDAEHYLRAVDGDVGRRLSEIAASTSGHRFIAWWFDGFRNVYTRTRAVESLSDMAGLKIRAPQSPIFVDTFTALGANPTPLAFPEIYTALEAGVIDGYEGSNGIIWSSKLYEVTSYRVRTLHMMVGFGLVIAQSTWERLGDDTRSVLLAAAQEAQEVQRALQLGSEADLDELFVTEGGLTENRPDLAEFRAAVEPVVEAANASGGTAELYDAIISA